MPTKSILRHGTLSCLPIFALSCPPASLAHDGEAELIDELIVLGRAEQRIGEATSASEGIVGFDDIRLPPLLRVGELTEAVPGMVATQHSGTGKANQYFLRGFNLDHGTDFSGRVNGVPVNLRTHGHGQGYLDFNFVIPELVATTTYRKGPYDASVGDFSSAGSVDFDYFDRLERSVAAIRVGSYGFARGFLAGSAELGGITMTAAIDNTRYDGPWELSEDLRQTRGYLALSRPLGNAATGTLRFAAYEGEWFSTDQVPRRAIESGLIPRTGFIDPDLGGHTDRYELSALVETRSMSISAYMVDYDFSLFSNFTYLLDRPGTGDQFEQVDQRRIYGADIEGAYDLDAVAPSLRLNWGGNVRIDDIDTVALYDTIARARVGTVREDNVLERSFSGWAALEAPIGSRLRASAGIRYDGYDWDVDALRSANGGSGNDGIVSPRLNLAWRLAAGAELYVNYGRGFHSNDVRGATIAVDPRTGEPVDPVDALVASEGYEIGLRFEADDRFNATLSVFDLDLDSELLFVGDAGTTEANPGSHRIGVEATAFWQPWRWLAVNASYTYTDAEYRALPPGEREIPGAVAETASLGLYVASESGLFASLRGRYLGDAPLVEDGSIRDGGSTLVNAGFGYRWPRFELRVDVFNLFDSTDNDITYFYASRLPGEPDDGIEDVHLHPLEPRAVRASLSYSW